MTTALSGKPTFGAGRMFATANLTNPTPARALVPQSQSIDFKRKTESLFGENQLAVAVGAGQMDVTGKVEYSKSQARILSDIMLGASGTAGNNLEADKEAGVVPGSSTYVITVVNATNFLYDLGVINATTGVIYSRVASGSEIAGTSYSVSTSGGTKGKYTFAMGDANANMSISYVYSNASGGETVVMGNQLQGLTGNFQAIHVLPWGTEQDMYVFNNCIASSAGLSLKQSGFGSSTLEYVAAVDGTNTLGTATFAEAA